MTDSRTAEGGGVMGVCCCSLAGTAACKYCSNNPDAERPPVVCTYTTAATDLVLITGTKTNADKIRAMTDEEIAEWFWWMLDYTKNYTDSRLALIDWLKKEATE